MNFQNIPKRNPLQGVVRRALCPKLDFFIEADYKAAEIKVLAMYSQDQVLIDYIKSGYDMHRQWASKLYELSLDEVSKDQRSNAKSSWVFPKFYGAWWKSCAKAFSELKKPDSFFEKLSDELEKEFRGVFEWQRSLLDFYTRNHYIETFLKFRRRAPLSRNEIINFPIQATAFHLLLDGVCRVSEQMEALGLKSHAVAQVHDSLLIDTDADEVEQVIEILEDGLCSKRFEWELDVPMEIEMEIGRDWFTTVELNPKDVDGSIDLLDKKIDAVEAKLKDTKSLLDSAGDTEEEGEKE